MAARTDKFVQELRGAGVRVTSDTRDNYTPGWKYNHWELKVSPPSVHVWPFWNPAELFQLL